MRRFQLLSTATFLLVLVAFGVSLWLTVDNRRLSSESRALAAQGEQAHTALCVFRRDLARRAAASAVFLAAHPLGLSGLATAAELRNALVAQQATLASLSGLECEP